MNVDNNLGDIFRSIRLQKKLTQAELQRLSGVTQSTISDIEEGKRSPQLNTLEKLCDAMGIPVVELLSTKEKFLSSDRLVLKEELEMLKLFRSLSPDQRLRLITFIQSFLVE
ncbi:helix-turn-helix transcriptional regulator [Bacillus cereus]|nr:helix-turn-helix transcriptional regulator [Bacillus cereus]